MRITIDIESCTECPHHEVVGDPDPHDSFCSDDVAVLCTKMPNSEGKKYFASILGAYKHRPVTVSCRPHRAAHEARVPEWCPLKNKEQS